jgi:hypothetical protein
VTNEREAVRFVADLLYQVQARIAWREARDEPLPLQHQRFEPGLALGALRHTDHADVVHANLGQRRAGRARLAPAAIHQD